MDTLIMTSSLSSAPLTGVTIIGLVANPGAVTWATASGDCATARSKAETPRAKALDGRHFMEFSVS
jgi:hypothetical protein